MLYPFAGGDETCLTQPLITMKNIELHNVTTYGGLFPAGIIRCDPTNPCTGFVWDNVHTHSLWRLLGYGFITENISGTVNDSKPVPQFDNLGYVEEEFSLAESILGFFVDIIEEAWQNLWPLKWMFRPANNEQGDTSDKGHQHFWDQKPW
jgi:hypothetical protein